LINFRGTLKTCVGMYLLLINSSAAVTTTTDPDPDMEKALEKGYVM